MVVVRRSLGRVASFLVSERLWERLSWPEAVVAFAATPVVVIWFSGSIEVLVGVTMWTWFRSSVGNALGARAGRRANPEDPL